ncbi:uncharacterized protein BX664DRAFT_338298 [Halteromyces radiatus]|uniref:uncharacterized protein n=1 Tax=Halteromyces radiatus TaxID=101107 RepID=UPI002220628A|nr:uncharacterized protein BX664DRAFT_338298 [Halteromyces radiatus]KAI8084998.1 hypothetical protein BX664DRAFT_338298 [Halteromyces radiatus]
MGDLLSGDNDEQYSSQVIEEEDLFLDDPSFDEETAALFDQAVAQHDQESSSTGVDNMNNHQTSLRSRLAGASAHKAGLDSLDKERVNQIIYEASKGSAFFENERKKDQALTKRIDEMLWRYDQIKDLDLSFETKIVDHKIREMEDSRDLTQCICHVDMDAFYASVEELDDPSLKDVPMAVGGMSMLCTSNYLARKSGVRSGMPGFIAIKLCPSLKLIPLHFPKYRAASAKVRAIFTKYDPDFLPMSLDEAYLNLTKYLSTTDMSPEELVQKIRNEIFEETKLTASAGIAANRMLAKVCSDMNKPNGQYFLPMEKDAIMNFTKTLAIRKVSGVGRVTERVLEALDVKTCGDIYHRRALLYKLLSPISFKFMLRCYLGIGSSNLHLESARKSMSVERTFSPISDRVALFRKVDELSDLLAKDLAKDGLRGKTVGIKLKLTSFTVRVRSKTFPGYISNSKDIARIAKELVEKELPVDIRLMGIRMSSLQPQTNEDHGMKKYFTTANTSKKRIPAKREHSDDTQQTISTMIQLICPICNRLQQHMDNHQFNHHVDECLTKMEVRSILQEQLDDDMDNNNRKKRLTSTSKRRNNDNNDTKSLLDYYYTTSS